MATYTVHKPGSNLKVGDYLSQSAAFKAAYKHLPLDTPGIYNPEGKYVTVQEWDDNTDPLRQWIISGRR
jgi:hypothetical protein